MAILRDLVTGSEFCVATTHLKARNGALLAALRNEQGKDLLDFVTSHCGDRPVIVCGDFNAEPAEPVYSTVTTHPALRLASAYAAYQAGEPPYTTWKVGVFCLFLTPLYSVKISNQLRYRNRL